MTSAECARPDAPRRSPALLLVRGISGAAIALTAWTGCGGDAVAPRSQATPPQAVHDDFEGQEPRSIEEAQAQIARARAQLDETDHAPESNLRKSLDESKKPEPPKSAPTPVPSPQEGAAQREESASKDESCGAPCRALASMKRAVESLCRMAGEEDTRCVEAKRTLSESHKRLATCRCVVR